MQKQQLILLLGIIVILIAMGFILSTAMEREKAEAAKKEAEREAYETVISQAPPIHDDLWILLDDITDSPPKGQHAKTYYMLGVKVEGEYFWWCDGEWKEIEPPCEVK